MLKRLFRGILEYFVLSRGGRVACWLMSSRYFPWGLWNVTFRGQKYVNGPVKIEDNLPKVIGTRFSCTGNLLLGGRIKIGDYVSVNNNAFIVGSDQAESICIGDNVLIGPNVVLRSSDHNYLDGTELIRNQGHLNGKITVHSDVWIAANAVVTRNVELGKGSVIGAGSVVTKSTPELAVVVGVPSKQISSRAVSPSETVASKDVRPGV